MLRKTLSLAVLVCAASVMAQNSPSNSSSTPNPQQRMGRQGGQEPCWEVAGIQKNAIEQVWALERETHSQVEAVCSNSSLTPQQKHVQVRELREQTHQKVESLITPEQSKALESCRQERGMEHQAVHGEGGCGEGRQGQTGWRQGGSQNGSSPNSQNNGNHWNNNSQSNSSAQN